MTAPAGAVSFVGVGEWLREKGGWLREQLWPTRVYYSYEFGYTWEGGDFKARVTQALTVAAADVLKDAPKGHYVLHIDELEPSIPEALGETDFVNGKIYIHIRPQRIETNFGYTQEEVNSIIRHELIHVVQGARAGMRDPASQEEADANEAEAYQWQYQHRADANYRLNDHLADHVRRKCNEYAGAIRCRRP